MFDGRLLYPISQGEAKEINKLSEYLEVQEN
jgi:hypothetical protein